MQRQQFAQAEAYVLKRHPYRENHYLLDIFTAEYGRFRASARLAKQKTYRMTDLLAPFHCLQLEGQRKQELASIFASRIIRRATFPTPLLLNACYLNELILAHLPADYADAGIYAAYQQAIADPQPCALRQLEQILLEQLYQLPQCHDQGRHYRIRSGEHGAELIVAADGYPAELIHPFLAGEDISAHPLSKNLLQTLLKLQHSGTNHTHHTASALKKLLNS